MTHIGFLLKSIDSPILKILDSLEYKWSGGDCIFGESTSRLLRHHKRIYIACAHRHRVIGYTFNLDYSLENKDIVELLNMDVTAEFFENLGTITSRVKFARPIEYLILYNLTEFNRFEKSQ